MRDIKWHLLVLLYVMSLTGLLFYFQRSEIGGQSVGLSPGGILTVSLAFLVAAALSYSFARMVVPPPGHRWRFIFAGLMVIFIVLLRAVSPRWPEGGVSFYLRVCSALLVLNLAAFAVRRLAKERRPPERNTE